MGRSLRERGWEKGLKGKDFKGKELGGKGLKGRSLGEIYLGERGRGKRDLGERGRRERGVYGNHNTNEVLYLNLETRHSLHFTHVLLKKFL